MSSRYKAAKAEFLFIPGAVARNNRRGHWFALNSANIFIPAINIRIQSTANSFCCSTSGSALPWRALTYHSAQRLKRPLPQNGIPIALFLVDEPTMPLVEDALPRSTVESDLNCRLNDSLLYGAYRLFALFSNAWRRDLKTGDNLNEKPWL